LAPRWPFLGRTTPTRYADNGDYHCHLTFAHNGVRWDSLQTAIHPAPVLLLIARAVMADLALPA
jgi:hypothetical protein